MAFFFNDTPTTDIYTLSLHDALPICLNCLAVEEHYALTVPRQAHPDPALELSEIVGVRSEEHTSEFQSHSDLVCRLLLEKKKITAQNRPYGRSNHRTQRNDPERFRVT